VSTVKAMISYKRVKRELDPLVFATLIDGYSILRDLAMIKTMENGII